MLFLNVASDHVLTSITGASAWPNHHEFFFFFYHHSKTHFDIAIVSFGKFCDASSTRGRRTGVVKPIRYNPQEKQYTYV